MFRMLGRTTTVMGLVAVTVCLLSSAALADLTVKQKGKTSGLMGFLNMDMETVTYLKGEIKCDDAEMKMSGGIMKMMGGGKPIKTTTVVNLADGTMMNVDHMSKTCNQMDLSQIGDMASQYMGGANGRMPQSQQFDTSQVKMEPPEITVNKTGNSEKIAGYSSDEYLINMHIKGVDTESGNEFNLDVDLELWIAKDVPGYDEYKAFNQKMVEKMGMDAAGEFGGTMTQMMAMYGVDSEELAEKAAELDGFPMRTVMKMKGDGGQFDEINAANPSMAGEDGEGGQQSEMASKMLKGLFGGGGNDEDGDPAAEGYFMTVRTEVEDISTKDVKTDKFECPSKYDVRKQDIGTE